MIIALVSRRRFSSARIWAWMVVSSAVVGSSARIRSGSLIVARAIITRWRWPPDSSCGYAANRSSGEAMPTARNASTARRVASARLQPVWRMAVAIRLDPIGLTGLNAANGS